MGIFRELFRVGNEIGGLHHTVIKCGCGLWYELRWKTGKELMFSKAEFSVVCAGCGERVYSRGWESEKGGA